MNIQPAILSTPLLTKPDQHNLAQLLLGQILNATVVNKKSETSFILQIGNQQIEAQTKQNKPLNVGEQLKLIVEKQSNPTTLRVLEQNPAKATQEVKQQLLRESMPKQAGLEKLNGALNQISKNFKEAVKILPAPIEQQFKKFIEHLPVRNNLSNELGLKTAIKNSGIFLEAKLLADANSKSESKPAANSPNPPLKTHHHELAKDLKTNLLQLAEVANKYKKESKAQDTVFIKQAAKGTSDLQTITKVHAKESGKVLDINLKAEAELLSKTIESSIARIEVNQSKAIVTHDNQSPVWSIEMPVKDKQDIDLLKLNIQSDKESKSSDENNQFWTTDIKITFEKIGSISARLSLIDKEINATLWSNSETLNELINNNLSLFNKQIEKCGLATGKIVCMNEAPVKQNKQAANHHLINIAI